MPPDTGFPANLPPEKPTDRLLSAAMHRLYDLWDAPRDPDHEFSTNFAYSELSGIGREQGVSRRDPSSVIKVHGTYYVWYTRRKTKHPPAGPANCTDEVPAYDWDHADIYYATSEDGFSWTEQGVAVARTPKGSYGDRAATTVDVLAANGRYYLYYQTFTGPFRPETGDYCDVSMAWAESPRGPWNRLDHPVVELGREGEWDSRSIHDPFVLVYQGRYWLYYKGQPLGNDPRNIIRAQGVAIADRPEGPFVKSPLSPVINSGHETCFWPYRGGIATIVSLDGPEKNTIQYAPDGLRFDVMAHVDIPPVAPGPFCPDAFADSGDGRGITWGLCHMTVSAGRFNKWCYIARFDCDLHRDADRRELRRENVRWDRDTHFQQAMLLTEDDRSAYLTNCTDWDRETSGTDQVSST